MFDDAGITKYIEREFSISSTASSAEQRKGLLIQRIHELMLYDLNALIAILYRVDVSESGLKQVLHEADTRKAAEGIADLIINRQLQKIKLRNTFPESSADIDENEKW